MMMKSSMTIINETRQSHEFSAGNSSMARNTAHLLDSHVQTGIGCCGARRPKQGYPTGSKPITRPESVNKHFKMSREHLETFIEQQLTKKFQDEEEFQILRDSEEDGQAYPVESLNKMEFVSVGHSFNSINLGSNMILEISSPSK